MTEERKIAGVIVPSIGLIVERDDKGLTMRRTDGQPMSDEFASAVLVKLVAKLSR